MDKNSTKTFLIYGVSKGLGKAIAKFLPQKEDKVFGISRTKPDYIEDSGSNLIWIKADLSNPHEATATTKLTIGSDKIDCLIYNVGIWEKSGFTADYDFEGLNESEVVDIINTNVTSAVLSIKSLLSNLKLSGNGKIILIGSTFGMQNHNKKEVLLSVTKFALRGVVHSLRVHLKKFNIGITSINLGDLATEYEYEEGESIVIEKFKSKVIPLSDVIKALQFIISTSNATCVKEIDMPSMKDPDV